MFDGLTFEKSHDKDRLASQLHRTFEYMSDGKWATLSEISEAIEGSEASVSARLRDFRKEKFGNHNVERRRRGNPKTGIWEYKLITNGPLLCDDEASRVKALGYSSYEEYLESKHWKQFKTAYFSVFDRVCFITGQTQGVVLHHITYINLGKESYEDVVPLSEECHKLVHAIHKTHEVPLKKCHLILRDIIHTIQSEW